MMYKNDAAIAVKVGGKVVREVTPGNVNIPFQSEYSVYFKNLSDRSCVAKISIDGENVGPGLIVKSNESVDLDCFIELSRAGRRFKFIAMTDNIAENRGVKTEDGIIRVEWQFEKKIVYQDQQIIYWPQKTYFVDPIIPYWQNSPTVCDSFQMSNISNVASASCYSSAPCRSLGEIQTSAGLTGFTTKGSESDQKFKVGQIGFLESNKYSACIYMTGVDKPVVTTKDKIKCEICGQTNVYTNKYCIECGTFLNR